MKIRKYKNKDEIQILKLDRLVEEHPWNRRNLKNWYWKYKGKNPFGRSLVWVAEKDKKIVATFSIIPLEYIINQKKVLGACSIAMIVHPDYQNKGLIKFVADKLFEDATFKRIKFIYGYPNERAYQIHKKIFLYEDISMQKLFYRKLDKKIIINKTRKFKVEKTYKFSKNFTKFLTRGKKQRKICLNRNIQFLKWRYLQRPDHKYSFFLFKNINNKICGYVVLKIYKENKIKRGHIIDIFYDKNENIFSEIIKFSEEHFYKKKCNEITLWLQGDQNAESKLMYFSYKIINKRPMICKFLNKNIKKKLLAKNWFFTMGDTLEIY
ncbi:MAG: GNAT family N-acetyltransferase [Pseudomonadota bacterium]|nr:GNAT family N-acetyltransferase [Pseudomonadota bacterium]